MHALTVLRIFNTKRASLYVDLFNLYINPIVTYGSVVYGSAGIGILNEIEKIMKYFTKRLWIRWNSNKVPLYASRLKFYNLKSLEEQCIRCDLISHSA